MFLRRLEVWKISFEKVTSSWVEKKDEKKFHETIENRRWGLFSPVSQLQIKKKNEKKYWKRSLQRAGKVGPFSPFRSRTSHCIAYCGRHRSKSNKRTSPLDSPTLEVYFILFPRSGEHTDFLGPQGLGSTRISRGGRHIRLPVTTDVFMSLQEDTPAVERYLGRYT